MKGIGLILPNADFSSSPLGQVTIAKSLETVAMEVAVAYGNAIDTPQYNTQVASLVKNLMRANLWDKVHAVYPILGTTLSAKSINLKNPQYFNLLFGKNASVANKGVSFVDTVDIEAKEPDKIYNKAAAGYTAFICARDTVGKQNLGTLVSSTGLSDAIKIGTGYNNGLVFYLSRNGVNTYVYGISTAVKKITFHIGDASVYNISDGVKSDEESSGSNLTLLRDFTNEIGYNSYKTPLSAETQSAEIFSGELYGYAFGWMSDDEAINFDEILRNFYSSVKGL